MRDLRDRHDVGRDVLAGPPGAPGGGAGEPAVLVRQVHRETVDLQLAQQVVVGGPDVLGHAVGPGGEPVVVEDVVEGEHALAVLHLGEIGLVLDGDLLGRRVRGTQLGVLVLQRLQGAQEFVELRVADDGSVLHVVPEAVLLDLFGEPRVLLAGLGGHRCLGGYRCGLCVLVMRPPCCPPVTLGCPREISPP